MQATSVGDSVKKDFTRAHVHTHKNVRERSEKPAPGGQNTRQTIASMRPQTAFARSNRIARHRQHVISSRDHLRIAARKKRAADAAFRSRLEEDDARLAINCADRVKEANEWATKLGLGRAYIFQQATRGAPARVDVLVKETAKQSNFAPSAKSISARDRLDATSNSDRQDARGGEARDADNLRPILRKLDLRDFKDEHDKLRRALIRERGRPTARYQPRVGGNMHSTEKAKPPSAAVVQRQLRALISSTKELTTTLQSQIDTLLARGWNAA
jgi:hypothetical protein